ncbi:MAG: hypothetical protein JWO94_2306 [Verrucomicrobiaceae bacterium]|nr:hypothetical protein [Verrucomicrobiaceae bacterium]
MSFAALMCPGALLACLLFQAPLAWAGPDTVPAAFITASYSGRFFFKMVGGLPNGHASPQPDGGSGHGESFEVLEDGALKQLWAVTGWYARELFLSDDGRTLVRLESLHPGRTVSKSDLAVVFYRDGVMVREYHTADLVRQPDRVRYHASGYVWLAPLWVPVADSTKADGISKVARDPEATPVLDSAGMFRIKTIDRIVYQFEASTGKLVKRTTL